MYDSICVHAHDNVYIYIYMIISSHFDSSHFWLKEQGFEWWFDDDDDHHHHPHDVDGGDGKSFDAQSEAVFGHVQGTIELIITMLVVMSSLEALS